MTAPPRIVIPVYQGFDLLDLCGPSEMFSWAGFQVDLVAEVPGTVTSNNGFVFQVENGLPAASPADALWVPGGNPDTLARIIGEGESSAYLGFLKAQSAEASWTCSVCEGALLLERERRWMKRLASRFTWWHKLPHNSTSRSTPQ